MQEQFPWYVRPTEEEFQQLWEEATFVFDANVLLDLYRFSRTYKEDFIDVIEKLEGRVWLPHQVAEEFMRNRALPISRQLAVLKNTEERVAEWAEKTSSLTDLKESLEDVGNRRGPVQREIDSLLEKSSEFEDSVKNFESHILEEIEALRKELLPTGARANKSSDDTLEKLESIVEDSIGESFEKKRLKELYQEGEKRFAKKIPPGFKDSGKNTDPKKYGDWILWKQILDYAEAKPTSVIFVTSETKEDWWEEESGQTVGPLPKLRKEFQKETEKEFWMYPRGQFLKYANRYVSTEVSKSSIEETEKEKNKQDRFSISINLSDVEKSRAQQTRKMKSLVLDLELDTIFDDTKSIIKKIKSNKSFMFRYLSSINVSKRDRYRAIESVKGYISEIQLFLDTGEEYEAISKTTELVSLLQAIISRQEDKAGQDTTGTSDPPF